MSAKVRKWKGAWWVFVHHRGTRRTRKIGSRETDRRRAERIALEVNAAITAGTYSTHEPAPLPCDETLRSWLSTYRPTMKPSYADSVAGVIENHLAPFFGSRDLREI